MVESLRIIFGRSGQAAVFCVVALAAGAGCQSAPAPAAVPTATGLEVTVEDADQPEPATPRPTYSDGYPSFAGSLNAANVQMTNEEAQALQFRLTALSQARKAGTISEAEYQAKLKELRKLAAEHGADTQALIAK
ncbi:SHOCT domain-containing protein [Rhizobium sp. AG855]|uniref:SHOCT domain-containing protein n=1 Tax=Rhizobium sp. AG855 TaxID=2183898 RepID=UPI000E770816|nr:SHOCT domain-containing protein [Rhizobium sp. AG855]